MDYTLLGNLFTGLKEAKKQPILCVIFGLTLLQAGATALVGALNFKVMKSVTDNDKESVIKLLFIIAVLECVNKILWYFKNIIYQKNIVIDMTKFFKKKFLKALLLESNHDWLNCNKSSEINNAIDSGTRSLMSTLRFLPEVINPLFQSLASIFVMTSYIGIKTMIAIAIMIVIFIGGSRLLYWEYHERTKINKETNPLSSYNVHLTNTFLVSLLNGNGEKTLDSILENSIKWKVNYTNIFIKTKKGYTFLELFGIMTIFGTVYMLSDTDIGVLIAINMNLNSVIDKMWWLFFMFHNASSEAAEWSALEDYLKSVVEEDCRKKTKLYDYSITDHHQKSKEYQIVGKSGSGKSTWMLAEVISLYRNYNVNWIYLDQRMIIPKTSYLTIREFLSAFVTKDSYSLDSLIIDWAKYLELEAVINRNTLYKCFESPSGGEEKRIIILQKLLPILNGESNIKVIFADEITAGLDPNTHKLVRSLIERLKTEYDITIVNIDHHEYESSDLVKIGVVKEETLNPDYLCKKLIHKEKSFYEKIMDYFDISRNYVAIKKEKSIKYPPKVKLKTD